MILDTSALVAILAEEPDSDRYIDAISHASRCRISAGNFLELSMVIEGQFGADVLRQCDALVRRIGYLDRTGNGRSSACGAPGVP